MKDTSGKTIRLGDRVRICTGESGVVVFSIDTDEYSSDFPKSEWEYLQSGIMIRTAKGALIHTADPHDLEISVEEPVD